MNRLLIPIVLTLVVFLCGFNIISPKENEDNELRGVFLSYIEEKKYLTKDEEKSKENIRHIITNLKENNYNLLILQVRANADSLYKSKYYPTSAVIDGIEGIEYFDVLDYFLKICKEENIKLYAWINPYRIRTTEDIASITPTNPAYKYLNTDYVYINNGIYFNPSKKEVQDLILNGIEEIVKNYEVDGLLYDDYFYPSDEIDINDYNEYIKKNEYISIKDYRLNVINSLIKSTHDICQKYNIRFGVSPNGNINNNYDGIYADVYKWGQEKGFVDFIMPQLYYGFFNESMPFYEAAKEWNNIIRINDVSLIIALSLYKSGEYDKYAKSGSEEWINEKDIIKRQVLLSRNLKKYEGFAIYRYDYLFCKDNMNENLINEIDNLHKILN